MARTVHSPDDFDAIAKSLEDAAKAIRDIAEHIRGNKIPHPKIHGTTVKTVYVRQILDWIGKAREDTESQWRAHLAGIQSKADLHKKQSDRKTKLAAAKKPFTSKRAKKEVDAG